MIRTLVAFIVLTLLAAPASAQDTASRVDAMLERILLEGQVLVTCFSLINREQPRNLEIWASWSSRTLTVLENAGYDPVKIAAFRAAARLETLRPAPDALFSEVEAFCVENSEVTQDILLGRTVRLPGELERAFEP